MQNEPSPLRLRVDDETRAGVFATGLVVYTGTHEFVLDFIQNMESPIRVMARVVVPHAAMDGMVEVLRQGASAPAHPPGALILGVAPSLAGAPAPTTTKDTNMIYDDIKVPDALHKGVYANALITAHNDQVMRMDFVAQFVPQAVLSARVFVTKAEAGSMLATVEQAVKGRG